MKLSLFATLCMIITLLLILLISFACNLDTADGQVDIVKLKKFWQDESGLYYLDLSGDGPVSFVLPQQSATMSPESQTNLKDNSLILTNKQSTYVLNLSPVPSLFNLNNCLLVEKTRLCEAEKY